MKSILLGLNFVLIEEHLTPAHGLLIKQKETKDYNRKTKGKTIG